MLSQVVTFIVSFRAIQSYFIKILKIFTLSNATTECSNFENLDKITLYRSKTNNKRLHLTLHEWSSLSRFS